MAETTHTSNLQLKLIGSGREAGTWGDSTNENLVRLESALTRTVSLDVTAMPIGSTSAASNGSTPATWITVNASDSTSAEAGSEGRAQMVEFKGTVTGNITVNIRGADSGVVPARVFFVKNSLTAPYTLTLDGNGTDYTIQNGKTVAVAVVPSTTGGFAAGVHNAMSDPQFNSVAVASGQKVNFLGNGTVDFDGTGTITVGSLSTNAFRIIDDNALTPVTIDTLNAEVTLGYTVLNVIGAIEFSDGFGSALTFRDSSLAEYIKFNSSANTTVMGQTVDYRSATFDLSNQATTFKAKANTVDTFRVTDGTNPLLQLDSTTGAFKATVPGRVIADDVRVTGTDGYINFETTEGSSGYGLRNNSGTPEVKKTGGSWNQIAAYRLGLAIANATVSQVASANKQGSFDIGPIRVIFNTIDVGGTGSKLVTLGTGDGTTVTMATTLYTVMVCQADSSSSATQNARAWVESPSSRTFTVECNANRYVTYFAIGDSGL